MRRRLGLLAILAGCAASLAAAPVSRASLPVQVGKANDDNGRYNGRCFIHSSDWHRGLKPREVVRLGLRRREPAMGPQVLESWRVLQGRESGVSSVWVRLSG